MCYIIGGGVMPPVGGTGGIPGVDGAGAKSGCNFAT